jgi:hypothetical protein
LWVYQPVTYKKPELVEFNQEKFMRVMNQVGLQFLNCKLQGNSALCLDRKEWEILQWSPWESSLGENFYSENEWGINA